MNRTRHTPVNRVREQLELLLVEDNLADAGLVIRALNHGALKHRLTLIRDGEETLEFLHQQGRFARAPRPDLILLDLGLPKLDGREVLSEIKSDYELKDIAVIILTGSQLHEDRLRSELLHVDGYLTKPVDFDEFLSAAQSLVMFPQQAMMLPT